MKTVKATIETVFTPLPGDRSAAFSWRLMRRKKAPLLLVPERTTGPCTGFELYSAHRPLARLWSTTIPVLLRSPLARAFTRVNLEADRRSDWLKFLSEQAGVPADQLPTPALKFSGVDRDISRVVLLLKDEGGNPIRVIKVGLTPEGRAAIDREASLLSRLPGNLIGCVNLAGRFQNDRISAFATSFFGGKSLSTDVGIEKLFHAWLSDEPSLPVQNFPSWSELEQTVAGSSQWPVIRDALMGQRIRPTLYHGDFTPWNVRMINLENIRAYDWERGELRGIPAWDWFHFVVQTAILVKRYPAARVAAELEQLVNSPRFVKYAAAAGITNVVEPLLLAYLLHQKTVVKPADGGETMTRLFDLLWCQRHRWDRGITNTEFFRLHDVKPSAKQQIKSAFAMLRDLFWRPGISPRDEPGLITQFQRYWPAVLVSVLWALGVAQLPLWTRPHLMLVPFYLLPCAILAIKTDRRLASLVALLAAVAGPLNIYLRGLDSLTPGIVVWNSLMRLMVFQLVVLLLDRIRTQDILIQRALPEKNVIRALSGNWAVILIAVVTFLAIFLMDAVTTANLIFMGLYIIPCAILTLAMNWRWGMLASVAASISVTWLQTRDDASYQFLGLECWNIAMRLLVFGVIVLLLEQVRRRSILFWPSPVKDR